MTGIGIDLGGTKIEIARVGWDGSIQDRLREPTPQGDYHATIRTLKEMVSGFRKDGESVGIATPGAINSKGLLKNSNSTCLNGRPFKKDLEEALGLPVRMTNDANCLALSEGVVDGAAAGCDTVFGVILGTGVGGGLVVKGQVLDGLNAIGGEWGHNPLPWADATETTGDCYCGKKACIETFLSGPGMSERLRLGLSPQDIAKRAQEGDPLCETHLRTYEGRLARALAHVINVFDPHAIVLGGGVSNLERLYENVPVLLGTWVFGGEVQTPILRAKHGDSSGVRGAAWLWRKEKGPNT